jgi:hypothetical protein
MNPRLAWWIHPGKLALFFLLPVYVFIVYVVPAQWPHVLVLRGGCFLLGGYAATGLAVLVLFGLGAVIGGRVAFDQAGRRAYRVQPWVLGLVGALTILAYVIWFFPLLLGRIPATAASSITLRGSRRSRRPASRSSSATCIAASRAGRSFPGTFAGRSGSSRS